MGIHTYIGMIHVVWIHVYAHVGMYTYIMMCVIYLSFYMRECEYGCDMFVYEYVSVRVDMYVWCLCCI